MMDWHGIPERDLATSAAADCERQCRRAQDEVREARDRLRRAIRMAAEAEGARDDAERRAARAGRPLPRLGWRSAG